MGVIYSVGDDVADLLVPFIRENGGTDDAHQIEEAYMDASLGRISAHEFWQRVGLQPSVEDDYLAQLTLSDGLLELLQQAPFRFHRIVCLSNDVAEWSRKLRLQFDLQSQFSGWYISGDLGVRKPDPRIFTHMLADLDVAPSEVLFVDDRPKNLDAAAALEIQTMHYDVNHTSAAGQHRTINRLAMLLEA